MAYKYKKDTPEQSPCYVITFFCILEFFFNTYNDMSIFSKPPIFLHKINMLYVLFPPLFWLIYLRDLSILALWI